MNQTEPLLDLSTLITRPTIDIDGKRYEILSQDELSVLDSRRFTRWGLELDELQKGDEDSPKLEKLVDTIARKVAVGVPDEVFAKLSGASKIAVVEVFTGLLLRSQMGVAGATMKAMGNLPTGEPYFPGFNASTAAPRATGWKERLSRLFRRT